MNSNEVLQNEVVTESTINETEVHEDDSAFTTLERLARVEQRARSNTHRLDKHDEQLRLQQEQLDVLKQMNGQLSDISSTLGVVRSDVDTLKQDKLSRDAVDKYWQKFWSSTPGKLVYEALKYIIIGVGLVYAVSKIAGLF